MRQCSRSQSSLCARWAQTPHAPSDEKARKLLASIVELGLPAGALRWQVFGVRFPGRCWPVQNGSLDIFIHDGEVLWEPLRDDRKFRRVVQRCILKSCAHIGILKQYYYCWI